MHRGDEAYDRTDDRTQGEYTKLGEALLPHKYSIEDLRDELGAYSRTAYDLFVTIYPTITSGSLFAPIYFEDAIQLYKSVNNALTAQTGFGGMFIVYDEFSKLLEANLDKSKMLNFKVIQELAELSSRSSDPELHFACITHKDLLSYNNSDSFRTVVGRFRQIQYVHTSEQAYELIANAIEKKPGYACGFLLSFSMQKWYTLGELRMTGLAKIFFEILDQHEKTY